MAFLYSTKNRSGPISYFMITHHKFFSWPSQCFWGLQNVSVYNSSSVLNPPHYHLSAVLLPPLFLSVCFHPANFLLQILPYQPASSSYFSAYLPYPSMSMVNTYSFPPLHICNCLILCFHSAYKFLFLFTMHVCWAVVTDTCLEPLKTLTALVIIRLDWITNINSIETVFKSCYYDISKKKRKIKTVMESCPFGD